MSICHLMFKHFHLALRIPQSATRGPLAQALLIQVTVVRALVKRLPLAQRDCNHTNTPTLWATEALKVISIKLQLSQPSLHYHGSLSE